MANEAKTEMETVEVVRVRGNYGELLRPQVDDASLRMYDTARRLVAALDAPDEHGAWETGCAFDRKGRGESVNVDLYGVARVERRVLAVVQVRQFRRLYRNGWGNVRKDYYLMGRNEGTGQSFAHPIPSPVVHAAIRRDPSPASPVHAARAWIFDVPVSRLAEVMRQGDVAVVPVRILPRGERENLLLPGMDGIQVVDAHYLYPQQAIRIGGRLYASGGRLSHKKRQHATVRLDPETWYRIQVGQRAKTWNFGRPTAD